MTVALSPAERIAARLHARIVELEEAVVVDVIWRDRAGELASLDLAVDHYARWEADRREHEATLAELRALVEGPDAVDEAKREADRRDAEGWDAAVEQWSHGELTEAWGK